jgi:hypothetical protein
MEAMDLTAVIVRGDFLVQFCKARDKNVRESEKLEWEVKWLCESSRRLEKAGKKILPAPLRPALFAGSARNRWKGAVALWTFDVSEGGRKRSG